MTNKNKRISKANVKNFLNDLKDFGIKKDVFMFHLPTIYYEENDKIKDDKALDLIYKNATNLKINSFKFDCYKQYNDDNVIGLIFIIDYSILKEKKEIKNKSIIEIRAVNNIPAPIFINQLTSLIKEL